MFKSVGKLVYSPKTHLSSSQRWLILACDDQITDYYRKLFYQEFPYKGKLQRPVWGAHISLIRGESIPNEECWRMWNNKWIEFNYYPGVIDNGEYFWMKVSCKQFSVLRRKLGLSDRPKFGFHLTIGKIIK